MLRRLIIVGFLLAVGLTQNVFAGNDAQVAATAAAVETRRFLLLRLSKLDTKKQTQVAEKVKEVVVYVQAHKENLTLKLFAKKYFEAAFFIVKVVFGVVTISAIIACMFYLGTAFSVDAAFASFRISFVVLSFVGAVMGEVGVHRIMLA